MPVLGLGITEIAGVTVVIIFVAVSRQPLVEVTINCTVLTPSVLYSNLGFSFVPVNVPASPKSQLYARVPPPVEVFVNCIGPGS